MAETYSIEMVGVIDGTLPKEKVEADVHGGGLIRRRATITAASQADGDTIVLGRRKVGEAFAGGQLVVSATLGSATVKIGPRSDDDAYRAAAVQTATNAPNVFGTAAALKADPAKAGIAYDGNNLSTDSGNSDPDDIEEDIILTVGTAALPSSGDIVIDLFFSKK